MLNFMELTCPTSLLRDVFLLGHLFAQRTWFLRILEIVIFPVLIFLTRI